MSKRYLLTYPDGSKKHIGREERDALLLSASAKQIAQGKYAYIGQVHKFRSLSDLKRLAITHTIEHRRYLEGQFVFVEPHTGKKRRERLETPAGMHSRLIREGAIS